MLGLYYAIIGLFSGAICSLLAFKKSRNQKDWFTLGQVLPVISIVMLLLLTNKNEEASNGKYFHNSIEVEPAVESFS